MKANFDDRYNNSARTPLEVFDLVEGAAVTVSVKKASAVVSDWKAAPRLGLAAIVERITEIHNSMPPDAWAIFPLT